ncbi:lysM and putative peptidoglycan-binding domain-containing protein 1 isoform X2 [Apteryx rowi]|uniref:lysM and putative peptidoglycan-binding domain-containing protein 1 isoform X2 n=1 Tax=Apteryx rowi TaxID=308060 RepID=UPI000E1DC681|nr:lysM and putative peptidoglycan-binding domain-containing protein 1 isoform X2 [Apteryx rowi]
MAAPPGQGAVGGGGGPGLGVLPGHEHRLEPGDTLAGLALRYGVTIDAEILLSKAAATRRLREGDTGSVTKAEGTRAPDTGAHPAPQGARRALLGPRPLTRTPRAAALRDAEDEIFML